MRSWSWPKRSANSKPWDGQGSSYKSCCISYYGTPLQRPCFSRKHQHLSGDCGQPFLCGVPRHGCHPLCLGMVSLHGGLLSGTGRSAGISDRLLSPSHSGIGTPMLSYNGMAAVSAEYPHGRHDRADGANGLRFSYPGYIIYLSALYTFYSIISPLCERRSEACRNHRHCCFSCPQTLRHGEGHAL